MPRSESAPKPEPKVRRRIPKWALNSGKDHATGQQYYLRSIGRSLDVLDCFDGQSSLGLKEISRRAKLPESTAFRVLLTLEKHKYLIQNVDGTYQLAPKLLFGWLVNRANHVRDIARPEMERLANQFNETVSLAHLYEDRIHVLDSVETFHEIRIANRIGRVLPPHCSAMGKAITAFQDRRLADQILEVYGLARRTEHTIVDRNALFDDFTEIRRSGISSDREESTLGGYCIGAAIRSESEPVIAAISLSTPLIRMTPEREQQTRLAVLQTAQAIATKLLSSR
ncbi:MAG: IclR family transcriptional regulator [Acidobacteriota bacterium]